METKEKAISVFIVISQSKATPNDWKITYDFKNGLSTIFPNPLWVNNKTTRFGGMPSHEGMKEYATLQVKGFAELLGVSMVIESMVIVPIQ